MFPETEIQNASIHTAGVYVSLNGFYPFAVGTKLHNGQIPVIRLGGHRERYESGWQCAAREAHEEASLQVQPLLPQTTFLTDWDRSETELQEIQWQRKNEQEPVPVLVIAHCRANRLYLSLMYLAHAEGFPSPSSEVKGLLLLGEQDIHRICQEQVTLEQYLSEGGKAILNHQFDTQLVLEPFAQLRFLSRILRIQSSQQSLYKKTKL